MGSEYDRKFEEMKKYIPFLENMITRLESSSSTSSNPRQAQLDKIKSLRDLLQDEKKRMKMANLLKCEQVLVNLYAKVEQKDKLPGISKPELVTSQNEQNKSDLEAVRNKLKSVAMKVIPADDTLPEIARASETEVICTPGSKEPALFQRRPNRGTISPRQRSPTGSRSSSSKSPSKLTNKRNYTRVLMSPEPSSRRWTESRDEDKLLFVRRSPQKSSRQRSPAKYYKKERKQNTKELKKQKDLNIILKVPEHTLESLNTEDIISRILNCSDGDVDIDTLREVRSQIIGELKNTGAQDDISDLILKSYKHKKKSKKKQKGEIEEGELSDSESEAIGSIYGNLKIIEKDELPSSKNKSDDSNPSERKIQISLVFNAENKHLEIPKHNTEDELVLENFNDHENIIASKSDKPSNSESKEDVEKRIPPESDKASYSESKQDLEDRMPPESDKATNKQDVEKRIIKPTETSADLVEHVEIKIPVENLTNEAEVKLCEGSPKKYTAMEQIGEKNGNYNTTSGFKANFYKPLPTEKEKSRENLDVYKDDNKLSQSENPLNSSNDTIIIENATESPLNNHSKDSDQICMDSKSKTLNSSVVSEIDILQALKNDILSESLSIPGAETSTPLLHLPKITKVANTPEIITKKRISIEKYKAKTVTTPQPLFFKDPQKDTKKISLKLTEKEFERFKLNNLAAGDLSDDDIENSPNVSSNDIIYSNLAPRSPENEDKTASETTSPVIIPENPLKASTTNAKTDIDMRLLIPKPPPLLHSPSPSLNDGSTIVNTLAVDDIKNKLFDPRLRRDLNMSVSKESPNPQLNSDRTTLLPTPCYPNMTPNRTPNSMSFVMTPSQQSYEDQPIRKHIYAPTFSVTENSLLTSSVNDGDRQRWPDDKEHPKHPDHREKTNISYRPMDAPQRSDDQITRNCDISSERSYGRSDPASSIESYDESQSRFGWVEKSMTPTHYFGRGEEPMTSSHSYGRNEAPTTPSHYFGRGDPPMTPNHSYGRGDDVPMTPTHSFGRGERSMTPNRAFSRGEGPMTSSHSFGGSDLPVTPSYQFANSKTSANSRQSLTRESFHGFGRNDPRLNRTEYESQYTDRGRYQSENNYNARRENSRFSRGESIGRNDSDDQFNRRGPPYHREYIPAQRQSRRRDYESEQLYTRERDYEETLYKDNDIDYEQRRYHDYRRHGKSNGRPTQDDYRSRLERAPSVGRRAPSISCARAPSIGRKTNSEIESVTLQSDRTCDIDTSIRSTFQLNIESRTQDRFNDRRRRAASVGRTFTRETSVSRYNDFNDRKQRATSVGRVLKQKENIYNVENIPKKDYFHRASSVGRDLNKSKNEKSWSEIKADFASYKLKEAFQHKKVTKTIVENDNKKQNIKNDQCTKSNDKKRNNQPSTTNNLNKQISYSPRKNQRDPRVRKDNEQKVNNRDNNKNSKQVYSKKENVHGIVYSTDNIAQGKILGPGYGVKNYKIPKIKRPVEEVRKEEQKSDSVPLVDKKADIKNKNTTETLKNKEKERKDAKQNKSVVDKNIKKKMDATSTEDVERITRLKKKTFANSNTTETESLPRTRKPRKAIIESDSDDQHDETVKNIQNINPKPSPKSSPKKSSNKTFPVQDSAILPNQEISLDSTFGIDDIEIFPENMVSDPVLSNIDDLIADLDNDLTNSKINVPFNDIPVDNICSTSKNNNPDTGENSIAELSAFLNEQINTIVDNASDIISTNAVNQSTEEKEPVTTSETIAKDKLIDNQMEFLNTNVEKETLTKTTDSVSDTTDVTVSTSETFIEINNLPILQNTTPDSTVNACKELDVALTNDDRLPDSTNEITIDNINLISKNVPSNETQEEQKSSMETPDLESIGNLLTMLQNKEKIKQLINMLGNQDQNDTIKKKLTKLSEIVETFEDETKIEVPQNENLIKESTLVHDIANEDTVIEKDKTLNDVIEDVSNKSESLGQKMGEAVIEMQVSNDQSELLEKQVIKEKNDTSQVKENEKDNTYLCKAIDKDTETKKDDTKTIKSKKKTVVKKYQTVKKGKGKALQLKTRVTRANTKKKPVKAEKKKTELQKLQEDLKEMFLKTDLLNTPGIRMCRLAKMSGDQKTDEKEQPTSKESEHSLEKPLKKKPGPKPKGSLAENAPFTAKPKPPSTYKPGPKSKTKRLQNSEDSDPYAFETDSTNGTSLATTEPKSDSSSDSEVESNASSVASIEPVVGLKRKLKRKRGRGWQSGIIKTKTKKNKSNTKQNSADFDLKNNTDNKDSEEQLWADISIPDLDCFTDTKYCFVKGVSRYHCRLCHYIGKDIVSHYKTDHPHSEVPLSRLHPDIAREAIIQCELANFQAISKMSTNKYVCRFCFQEFRGNKNVLERFFWHVASSHTGEYKQVCSECVNITTCPMNLDIIPPPKDTDGQLIGYICEKCNYTQISLENLKHHVISRHDDQQTVVYSINLSVMTNDMVESLAQKSKQQSSSKEQQPPTLRSSRSSVSLVEPSDICSNDNSDREIEIPKNEKPKVFRRSIQSKISFENDDNSVISRSIKIETSEKEILGEHDNVTLSSNNTSSSENIEKSCLPVEQNHDDIVCCPHFKINFNESGMKEYICCINGVDNHYRTTLLISMKKHVQIKHSEIWDGYCFICRAIVTPQGQYLFKDCFQHCLDKHMDSFPILEKSVDDTQAINLPVTDTASDNPSINADNQSDQFKTTPAKPYINVRPLAELLSIHSQHADNSETFPIIKSVVSLGSPVIANPVVIPQPSPPFLFQNQAPAPSPPIQFQNQGPARSPPITFGNQAPASSPPIQFQNQASAPSPPIQFQNQAPASSPPIQFQNQGPASSPLIQFQNQVPASIPPFQFQNEVPATPFVPSKYEEAQSEIMSKKHRVVLDAMMSPEKLARIFKCAGRFCSFSTDSADEALLHASTHARVGGENALKCAYCDFDIADNAIDLVTHVFKTHAVCQFLCRQCFYRAGSSQLVGAHIERYHKQSVTAGSVLKSQILAPAITNDPSELLPRKIAVPFYVCNNGNPMCNFKTYTPGKFTDHMIQKHGGDALFPCSVCQLGLTSPIELVKHLKIHGLMRYQCTWCIFGADNEADLLSHASEKHPAKQPQGYLRIITNKEGTNDYRVLPLANLNKYKVPFQEITPSNVIDNAVKEAERSIELEALIGSLNIESRANPPQAENENNIDLQVAEQSHNVTAAETVFEDDVPQFVPDQHVTPIKTEVSEKSGSTNAVTPTIICLDSDDDSAPSTPQKEASQDPTNKKISAAAVFKCPKCRRQCRNKTGFAKHVLACNVPVKELKCLHCSTFNAGTLNALISHLQSEHMVENLHGCTICNLRMPTASGLKKHMKNIHKIDEVTVQEISHQGHTQYIYTKRNSNLASPRVPEMFRPQDVARLPINPIFDSEVKCAVCGFSTKVRLNMVRHLQQHAQQQPAAATAPVNPVPVSGERYFDKMLNLAASSISSQRGAAQLAGRYPRFVPERQRRACGAPGCDYISVDDTMLRRHWDTLHPGATHYRCLHCPPTQQLDTSQPLTATRILAHLKMHDETLYACSDCIYHHFRKRVVEKHNIEAHAGAAQVLVVREEAPPETPPPAAGGANAPAAPTMDLKPWHCGLCDFKSMLRQQVAEHCSKIHRSKMQYKCSYCPYRASTAENVTKHQNNSHPQNASDIFYYYYKEDSIEDDTDGGLPRWVRQKQKFAVNETEEVKPEVTNLNCPSELMDIPTTSRSKAGSKSTEPTKEVDLNIVKYEPRDEDSSQDRSTMSVQLGEPNGLKFKCPYCNIVMEDTREAMQSHLFEELKYRRWSCSYCSYKAFHETGFNDHMSTEHRAKPIRQPVALPINTEIETLVTRILDHQSAIITKNRDKLSAQRIQTLPASSATAFTKPKEIPQSNRNPKDLELTFGSIGTAVNMKFACPKCKFTTKDDTVMQNHLESELNNIRWSCSRCSKKFVSYHEAQFHGKEHGEPARPLEVSREPAARAAWVQLVLEAQRRQLQRDARADADLAHSADNSLLAVRFEKSVPTPEEVSLARRKRLAPEDSDDEDRLLIDEGPPPSSTPSPSHSCPHCSFQTVHALSLREHILRHYKLRPYKCGYCDFTGHRKQVIAHSHAMHPSSPRNVVSVAIPDSPPVVLNISNKKPKSQIVVDDDKPEEEEKLLCLVCDKIVSESEVKHHTHLNEPQQFAKKTEVVVKCCRCTRLHKDVPSIYKHTAQYHPDDPVDYVYYKLTTLLREHLICGHCNRVFNALKDLLGHHHLIHNNLQINYTNYPIAPWLNSDNQTTSLKRKADSPLLPQAKRTARKSTSKLPNMVAKKSTTKLPQYVYEDSDTEEYSYYGTKPLSLTEYANVTTMMPFCNTLMPFKMKQLRDIIHIEPIVLVKDCELNKLPE